MCAHMCTLTGAHLLYTAASSAVMPAAAWSWWRKLSLNISSAPLTGFPPCAETRVVTAKMAPELHIIWQSEKLIYSSQKLKILLCPTLWIRSCGYVNTGMTSRDWNFSIKWHKCMSKPQIWSRYSDSSHYWRVNSPSLLISQTNCWQIFLMVF